MNLVSIIMPYFKKKNTIAESIDSILSQTYKNFELLIIYDDEDQKDLNFIKEKIQNEKRIRLIVNQKNLGAGFSRNVGIKNSKGNYIAFIDSDDTWNKEKLEKQLNFMKKNNYEITHTSYEIIDLENKTLSYRKARDFKNFESLLKSCDIALSTVLIDRKILDEDIKFPNLKTKEDFVLWLKFLKKNYKIFSINTDLTSWRKLNNSLSSSTLQKLIDGFNVYHKKS